MPRAAIGRVGLEHLRAWRVWKGYSQDELAERSGVAKPTISHLENGKATANFATVRKLAEGLGVTREQLLHTEPEG
jgi:transcriptional regulator with XRE-family HTH domain